MRCVVLGGTGCVGQAILAILSERALCSYGDVSVLGSESSKGRKISFGAQSCVVRSAETYPFHQDDVVFSAVSAEVARRYIPKALKAGARVIDKSSAYRKEVPLVVPEVNGHLLSAKTALVASPNCVAIPLSLVLNPLHKMWGVKRLVVSTYQAVSGAGYKGVEALEKEALEKECLSQKRIPFSIKNQGVCENSNALRAEDHSVMHGGAGYTGYQAENANKHETSDNKSGDKSVFGAPIALNVIPQIGPLDEAGISDEESKIIFEVQKILDCTIPIHVTAVRVPVFVGHGMSVVVDFEKGVDLQKVGCLLKEAPGIVCDDAFVTPCESAGKDDVFVGRVRAMDQNTLSFWCVSDNVRKGAALNAVQIAEKWGALK